MMHKHWFFWALRGAGGVLAISALLLAIPFLRERISPAAIQGVAAEVRDGPRLVATATVRLDHDVIDSLGIKVGEVKPPEQNRVLPPLLGSLTLDPNQLARVQARFPCEVIAIGTTSDGSGKHDQRPLAYGDEVHAGDLLAVLSCRELGEKKSELIDAWSQLQVDTETLERVEKLFEEGAVPETRFRQARRSVEAGKVALRRAEQTLRIWQIEDKEIQRLYDEAKRLRQTGAERSAALATEWARVEIRAPITGTILERNVNPHEIVNDPSRDLFKIGNLKQLKVWAYAAQEDLPVLMDLPRPLHWNVHLRTDASTCVSGTVERISELVDTNQRAVLLIGSLRNDQGRLRAGQLISATIEAKPEHGATELEVPTVALVEDGEESVVFVQPNAALPEYRLCPVQVVRRYRDVVLVRPRGEGTLKVGATVVTAGAVELRTVLENLQGNRKNELARANP
jgi:membrane fusion protein, heavy metal efflux system